MMLSSIRSRMLWASLTPIVVIVVVLVWIFLANRQIGLDQSHHQRSRLLLNQVALSSEYGLFSGNLESLQSVVNGMQREADVQSVSVFGADGDLLVTAGQPGHDHFDDYAVAAKRQDAPDLGVETLIKEVTFRPVQLDEPYAPSLGRTPPKAIVLGHAVIEMSRDGLVKSQQEILKLGIGVGLLGLFLASVLAIQLGEGVVQPILRVSQMVSQIGSGDLSARIEEKPGDPLLNLQKNLNRMAAQLAWGREELEQRVANVTAELREKKNEAEDATRAKSRFLAAASHDLRQPTHALGLFVARLGQMTMEPSARHLVGNIESSVRAMQDLLDDLLDVSRLEAGAVSVNVRPVALQTVLNVVEAALAPLAAEKSINFRFRPTPLWVLTDPALLRRMLMNLVHNALRYTPSGTVFVACRLAAAGTRVRLEVWDSGVGISPEFQTDIFKEFYQVDNSARDRTRGLGLGLNIVQRSAQLLGHPLALRSAPGCGSRFTITLPVSSSMPEVARAPRVWPDESTGLVTLAGIRVVLIEDDNFARNAVAGLLESWGCTVYAGASAASAIAAHENHADWDVILSDYRLADGDNGLLAIERLRAYAGRNVAAGLMSGDTDGSVMQAAKDANLTLLHKPVRPAKLRILLRRLTSSPLDEPSGTV